MHIELNKITNATADSHAEFLGGTTASNGAWISLYGTGDSTYSGAIRMRCNDGSDSKYLLMKPDGTFTWGGETFERVMRSGAGYAKYASGLLICWGTCPAGEHTITLPQPYKDKNYSITLGIVHGSGSGTWNSNIWDGYGHPEKTATTFVMQSAQDAYDHWTTVGFWK